MLRRAKARLFFPSDKLLSHFVLFPLWRKNFQLFDLLTLQLIAHQELSVEGFLFQMHLQTSGLHERLFSVN